jgi:uncharacterized membrane protein
MKTSRLEAFSDGVLAIIITIMVLELRVPDGPELSDLLGVATGLLTYLLSFVYVGIYWNNHHHMFQLVGRATGGILWSNLALLFCLSLLPFTTAWMDDQHFATTPVVTYGVNLLLCAIAYWTLQTAITRSQGPDGPLAAALGRDIKAKLSPVVYVAGVLGALVAPWLGVAIYAVVALMWLVPDRRVERYIDSHGVAEE